MPSDSTPLSPADLFDALADEYESMREELGWDPFPHLFDAFGAERSLAGKRILDIGCGTGEVAEHLSQRGAKVVGLDVSEVMCAYAAERVPDSQFFVADLGHPLQFEDDLFDGVIALGCVEYVEDLEAACAEMTRVTAPGGVVLWTLELCGEAYDGGSAEKIEFLGDWVRHRRSREAVDALIASLPIDAQITPIRGFFLEESGGWTQYARVIGVKR